MNKNDYSIRLETPNDYFKVENLTREAFWNVYRPGCFEHYILHCYRDREDFIPELDLVMEKGGEIVGHIMYVRSYIHDDSGKDIPIMTFGPISIAPKFQRMGYGKALLDYSMEKAKNMGAGALAITGNIDFYSKSGFTFAKNKNVRYQEDPDADYFLIKELQKDFLKGVSGKYKDPDGYFVDEQEAEKFDKQFPIKEKLKLPGQLV